MKKGFTLVEMLVVIGIIVTLIAATTAGYSNFVRKAQSARGTELVLNIRTALVAALQKEDAWPRAVLVAGRGGNSEMTAEVGGALAKAGVLAMTYQATQNRSTGETVYRLTGLDQCGVVSPWALDVIKRKLAGGAVPDSTPVPSGGTIADHRLRFAIDDDYDGYTDTSVSATGSGGAKVRASACVWCCGYDGKFGTKDDIYSWTPGQEVH